MEQKPWRGIFDGYHLPFEPRVVLLGLAAVIFLESGLWLAEGMSGHSHLLERACGRILAKLYTFDIPFLTSQSITQLLGRTMSYPFLSVPETILVFLWIFFLIGFFGLAICRIMAVRIARDEVIDIRSALKFSWSKKISYLGTPLFFLLVVLLGYGVNTFVGWIGAGAAYHGYFDLLFNDALGILLFAPLFLLVLVSTMFIILVGIGLCFGFFLMLAAIGIEGCEGLDALSRVYNLIYSRPWHYIFYHGILGLSLLVILALGRLFLNLSLDSANVKSMHRLVELDTVQHRITLHYRYGRGMKTMACYQPEETMSQEDLALISQGKLNLYAPNLELIRDVIEHTPLVLNGTYYPPGVELQHLPQGGHKFTAYILAGILNLIWCLVVGYLFSHLCAASSFIYLLLRKEVDGIEIEEVYLEEQGVEDELPEWSSIVSLPGDPPSSGPPPA